MQNTSKDFFISYNQADRAWAEWIAWQLEAEGYSTILQAWDFRPGSNFVLEMDQATKAAKRTIAVLSPEYLQALYIQPEWAAAFVHDPTGQQRKVLPVRVRQCTSEGLLATIVYIDLIGLNALTAQSTLLAGVHGTRLRPTTAPAYPGNTSHVTSGEPSFPGSWPELWHVPYRRNLFFTGREALLAQLHEQSTIKQATAITQPQAIHGLGGIGKTQTAIEYAYRYGSNYRFVLWVTAATQETLLTDFTRLIKLLPIAVQDEQDKQATIEAVKRWLNQQQDWLLIVDNADDLDMVCDYLPLGYSPNGHILLTTRARTAGSIAHPLDLTKMEQQEGVLLLLRRIRILTPGASLEQVTFQQRTEAEAIVRALDGLPLALDQAGAYIEETECSLTDYLHLYQRYRKQLLGRRGRLPSGHPETVSATWSLSFQHIEEANPAAAALLRCCAFLAPDTIPEEIITEGADVLGEELQAMRDHPLALNEAMEGLGRYSLIKRNREMKTLTIHRLVQAVIRDEMRQETQQLWAERVVKAVEKVFPSVAFETWSECERYLSQAEVCADLIAQYELAFPQAMNLLREAGLYWQDHAAYPQALPLYQRALSISEKTVGPEHPSTAATLHALAWLYQAMGDYPQALPLYQRALSIKEKTEGPEHPSTDMTLYRLATLYQAMGDYPQAETLFWKDLDLSEKLFGTHHNNTKVTLQALIPVLTQQGKQEQAERLRQRLLDPEEEQKAHE